MLQKLREHARMILVREGRVELPRVTPLEPKSSASTNSATLALLDDSIVETASLLNSIEKKNRFAMQPQCNPESPFKLKSNVTTTKREFTTQLQAN